MKSLTMLWQVAASEWGSICGACTTRDFQTVSRRCEDEGLSFLTITLPQFAKDLEKGLREECVGPDLFSGFRKTGRLPRFLGGFMDLIFERASGVLLQNPSVDAIQAVRWLTSVFGKLELPTSEERRTAAIDGYVATEKEVKEADFVRTPDMIQDFRRVGSLLWADVLTEVDTTIYRDINRLPDPGSLTWSPKLFPKHGPGATADRLRGNAKYDLSEWPLRLERVFRYTDYAVPNDRYFELANRVDFLEPGDERPVKLVDVPKTMKTPRLIAIEPTAMQYMQQAIGSLLTTTIRRSLMGCCVGFDDQYVNRRMAAEGSLTGNLATLDLSEASDRVSNQLVRELVSRWPHVAEAFDATRSRKADVPGHGVLRLAKFASMGSALTFPVEAMVFATVVFLGIERARRTPLTRSDIQSLRKQVRVYGDDIIVPTDYARSVVDNLEAFGFKVNVNKSFWTGKFRESCGREYFNGHSVSVDRLRKIVHVDGRTGLPTRRNFVSELESLVSFRNKCYMRGLWRTAAWLDDWVRPILWDYYPTVAATEWDPEEGHYSRAQVLGRWSFLGYQSERTHRTLHGPLVKGWVVERQIPGSPISGEGALQKILLRDGEYPVLWAGRETFADARHLERSGRPEAVRIKLRWTTPV